MKQRCLVSLIFIIVGWIHAFESTMASGGDNTHGTLIRWYEGSPDAAFAHAKTAKKPMFVYFGATWCPPCNEMKSFVFSNQKGSESLHEFIPVYLDGDSEDAQSWAEKLKIAGYPTMVFLSPQGDEITRILGSVSLNDFLERVTQAKAGQDLNQLLTKAISGEISQQQWHMLASSSWPDAEKNESGDVVAYGAKIDTLLKKIPKKYTVERSLLASKFLQAGMKIKPDDKNADAMKFNSQIKSDFDKFFGEMFLSQKTMIANQDMIAYESFNLLKRYVEGPSETAPAKLKWIKKINKAFVFLRESKDVRVSGQLTAWSSSVVSSKLLSKDQKFDPALVAKTKKVVDAAVKKAVSDFDRQSLLSTASDVLIEIGEVNAAKEMLLNENKTSKIPWYFYSSLASIEEEHGTKQEALKYFDLASQSAQGRATKAQWVSSNLMATIRLDGKAQGERVDRLSQEYFNLIFELDDGFEGRNKSRLKSVKKVLKGHFSNDQAKAFAQKYAVKCTILRAEVKGECERYFAEY